MPTQSLFARSFPTDPRFAPFGLAWLRGLTALRVGLVAVLVFALSLRRVLMFGVMRAHDAPLMERLAGQFFFDMTLAMPLLVLVTIADNVTRKRRDAVRAVGLMLGTLLGLCVSVWVARPLECLVRGQLNDCPPYTLSDMGAYLGFSLFYATPLVLVLFFVTRARRIAGELHAAQMHRADLERQRTEARLRTLRAQIEPHFLFNTLAHIQRLYQVEPAEGRSMLRNLSEYLRSALPQMRDGASTLGSEIALVRAYLNVQQIRMGRRLAWSIQVPEELQDADLPPMMLVTLVENAIKHGIGPKREGGQVLIGAQRSPQGLEIQVSDDGVGLPLSSGTGVGLANTRARLSTLFGDLGRLEILNGERGGVTALLLLPYRRTTNSAGAA